MIKSSFTSTRTNPSGRALSISDFNDAIGGLFAASCRSGTTTTAACAKLYQGVWLSNQDLREITDSTTHLEGSAVMIPPLVQMPTVFERPTILYASFGT